MDSNKHHPRCDRSEIKSTCYNGQINPISALGREITNSLLEHKHKPFDKDKILVQGDQGAHDICQWAMTAKLGTKDSTKIWENSLKKIWNTVERSEKQ